MKTMKLLPGIIISVSIAVIAVYIEGLLPIHLIGGAVIAMSFNIYDNLINEFNNLLKFKKTNIRFLLSLGFGIIISIIFSLYDLVYEYKNIIGIDNTRGKV